MKKIIIATVFIILLVAIVGIGSSWYRNDRFSKICSENRDDVVVFNNSFDEPSKPIPVGDCNSIANSIKDKTWAISYLFKEDEEIKEEIRKEEIEKDKFEQPAGF